MAFLQSKPLKAIIKTSLVSLLHTTGDQALIDGNRVYRLLCSDDTPVAEDMILSHVEEERAFCGAALPAALLLKEGVYLRHRTALMPVK